LLSQTLASSTADLLKSQGLTKLRREIDSLNELDDLKKDLDSRMKAAAKQRRSKTQLETYERKEASRKKQEEIAKRQEEQRK
jgi:hypothetical protein